MTKHQLNTQIKHTQFAKESSLSPSKGSHADYWSKDASVTLGVNAVILQEDLC